MKLADRLDVLAIDHVGIAVPDLDQAIAMYTGPFGGRVTHRETNPEQQVDEAMVAFDDGTQLQLIAPTSPASAIGKFIDRNGPGLQQLALRVPDVVAASQVLRDAGMRLLYPEPRTGTAGSKINFVHPKDAGGVLVELVQPAAVAEGERGTSGGLSDE
jgi:methylmalonyl-CoA/ethylmalonyl-CoA epimerase